MIIIWNVAFLSLSFPPPPHTHTHSLFLRYPPFFFLQKSCNSCRSVGRVQVVIQVTDSIFGSDCHQSTDHGREVKLRA